MSQSYSKGSKNEPDHSARARMVGLRMTALSFWSSGGDVIARGGVCVSDEMGRSLLAIFSDELCAAFRAGRPDEARNVARVAAHLTNARIEARRWKRASSHQQIAALAVKGV